MVLHRLGSDRRDGPCDDECGCLTADPRSRGAAAVAVAVGRGPDPDVAVAGLADACRLDRDELSGRLDDWHRLLDRCTVQLTAAQAVVDIPTEVDLAEVVELVEAETACCSFLEFDLRVGAQVRRLVVRAPSEHAAALATLVGRRP